MCSIPRAGFHLAPPLGPGGHAILSINSSHNLKVTLILQPHGHLKEGFLIIALSPLVPFAPLFEQISVLKLHLSWSPMTATHGFLS